MLGALQPFLLLQSTFFSVARKCRSRLLDLTLHCQAPCPWTKCLALCLLPQHLTELLHIRMRLGLPYALELLKIGPPNQLPRASSIVLRETPTRRFPVSAFLDRDLGGRSRACSQPLGEENAPV